MAIEVNTRRRRDVLVVGYGQSELEDLLGVSVDVISDGAAGVDRIQHTVAV